MLSVSTHRRGVRTQMTLRAEELMCTHPLPLWGRDRERTSTSVGICWIFRLTYDLDWRRTQFGLSYQWPGLGGHFASNVNGVVVDHSFPIDCGHQQHNKRLLIINCGYHLLPSPVFQVISTAHIPLSYTFQALQSNQNVNSKHGEH